MESINVIAISPHLFSGSYFFQALLDGHPELYSLGTHFTYPSKIRTNEDIKANFNIGHAINLIKDSIYHDNEQVFEHGQEMGIKLNKKELGSTVNFILINYLKATKKLITRREIVIAFHLAHAIHLGADLNRLKYLVIHLQVRRWRTRSCLGRFSSTRFIATLRDQERMRLC